MTAQLVDQVNELQWWHTIDLGNGVVTPGKYPPSGLNLKAFDQIDFTGKRVLDIGCWDGYWSFYAERGQAHRVLATDDTSQTATIRGGAMGSDEVDDGADEVTLGVREDDEWDTRAPGVPG